MVLIAFVVHSDLINNTKSTEIKLGTGFVYVLHLCQFELKYYFVDLNKITFLFSKYLRYTLYI